MEKKNILDIKKLLDKVNKIKITKEQNELQNIIIDLEKLLRNINDDDKKVVTILKDMIVSLEEKALDVYFDYHVSELKLLPKSVVKIWYVGQHVWDLKRISN